MTSVDFRSGRRPSALPQWCPSTLLLAGVLAAVLAILGGGQAAAARKEPKAAKKVERGKPRVADSGVWFLKKPADVTANQRGKIVVFSFRNDDGDAVARQVVQLLEARGLEVVTGVRPVDTAEQFRDVATALGLVGFVDGDVKEMGPKVRVTVRLRNGYTGRRAAEARIIETRPNLPGELSAKLWTKLGPATARVCVDAEKPRKTSRSTLRINAGTPIETVPAARMADENN